MAQRQFRSDDSDTWVEAYGSGGAGALSVSSPATDATANTTLTGTGGGTSATAGSGTGFANGDLVLIYQAQGTGAGNWELNKISSVGTGTNWTMSHNLINTYGVGAQVYLLKQYSTVSITAALTSQAWGSGKGGILAFLANNSITVGTGGSLVADGTGFAGGAQVGTGSSASGNQGESDTGAGASNNTAANGTGGGGGTGFASVGGGGGGGGGGHASAGTQGGNNDNGNSGGTAGGGATDVAGLTTMLFGGAGGSGGSRQSTFVGKVGGNGGSVVILIAPTIDTSAGAVTAKGTVIDYTNPGGGGAGAGGSILLKGVNLTLGTTKVDVSGGAGGTGSANTDFGGAGANGRIHADYATSISGTTTPTIDTRLDTSLQNIVTTTKTFTADGLVTIRNTKTFTTDTIIEPRKTKTFTADAKIKTLSNPKTLTVDAILRAGRYSLDFLTLKTPQAFTKEYLYQKVDFTMLTGKTTRDVMSNKQKFVLTMVNLTKAQVDELLMTINKNVAVNFFVKDKTISIDTSVWPVIASITYDVLGSDYRASVQLELTEVI